MFDRRKFLQSASSAPLLGSLFSVSAAAAPARRDYFKDLGIRPFINAAGTYTTLSASLMLPEVVDAIDYASKRFVRLNEIADAAGQRIASLVGSEAAMVTSGAAGALTSGTAACIAGSDPKLVRRLPNTEGMKNEVIIQKSHRYGYDHSVEAVGIRFIEVETADELEKAVNERTAMMLFFNANEPLGKINSADFVALGKKHNVPTFNDAAADVPPLENLTKYIKTGFDIVTFSGGKGLRGPQSAGVLLGRKDLIEGARRNSSPNSDTIGRGMKVNKEEMLGMMVAIEQYFKRDHKAEWREWERRISHIADSVQPIKGIETEQYIPEIANHVPHLRIKWSESDLGISVKEAVQMLRDGEPAIEVVPGSRESLAVSVWMLQPGEAEQVARRIRQVLLKKS